MEGAIAFTLVAALLCAPTLSGCETDDPVYCDTAADCAPAEDCAFFSEYRAQICSLPCLTDDDCPSDQYCAVGQACGQCDDSGCMTCPMSVNGCIP